ncbi:Rid family hydrolase [Streptomyces sp. GbtcB7]|uniref:RidA family protein n=1 Tax=Streptomyces sp. GbtcB7 TaxID=2824752 RepID=UPI001C30DD62
MYTPASRPRPAQVRHRPPTPAPLTRTNSGCTGLNKAYRTWFGDPLPSRTAVGVTDLALDAAVEIDVIAAIPESTSMAGTPQIAT